MCHLVAAGEGRPLTGPEIRWASVLFDFPADEFGEEVTFWRAIAGSTVSPPRGSRRQFASLEPFNGDPHLRVQRTDHGEAGVHLDLHVEDVGAMVGCAVDLGATVVAERSDDESVTLRSPAGFPFCAVRWQGEATRSRPIRWPGDTISIIDQLAIDVPAADAEAEAAFFVGLTGWQPWPGRHPEFVTLRGPRTLPIQLLIHATGSGPLSAHVDLASTHPEEEVARHVDWGATVVARMSDWTVMADPTGMPYCITRRNPRTHELPG
ncbi:VOC family protein [Williamsia sterculiae]|uniref:Glyoxalase-like domain-containing protein n=1 Tax=Williamsia sterculiae TaxID=1344003 RepID=A0A1N7H9Q4_9NOCA|nr:VOC family protein [Williamsia sterculiae]SIS21388.1 hypothetical protein SAMN05445060_3740 [Williamsia sterculiae]